MTRFPKPTQEHPWISDGARSSGGQSDEPAPVDARLRRVADLATRVQGLSPLTEKLILAQVKDCASSRARSEPRSPRTTHMTAGRSVNMPESDSAPFGVLPPTARLNQIEGRLTGIRRAYQSLAGLAPPAIPNFQTGRENQDGFDETG